MWIGARASLSSPSATVPLTTGGLLSARGQRIQSPVDTRRAPRGRALPATMGGIE
jgi:hypothetical protein